MGWLLMTSAGMGGHATPKAYLDAQFIYSRPLDGGGTRGMRVIDSAFVGNRVWYAAAEIIQDGEVKAEDGMRLRFPRAISFGDGHSGTEFIVVRKGERVIFRNSEGRGSYRITSFRDLAWTVVPETKVHRTVFA